MYLAIIGWFVGKMLLLILHHSDHHAIRNRQRIGTAKGGSRAKLSEGQLVVGVLKNFKKLVTRICCIQHFQIHFRSEQYNFEVILEAN